MFHTYGLGCDSFLNESKQQTGHECSRMLFIGNFHEEFERRMRTIRFFSNTLGFDHDYLSLKMVIILMIDYTIDNDLKCTWYNIVIICQTR